VTDCHQCFAYSTAEKSCSEAEMKQQKHELNNNPTKRIADLSSMFFREQRIQVAFQI
jgi:hypothetical protein